MEIKNRNSVFDTLKKYDVLSNNESDFIEITEWSNEDGFDINICRNNETKLFSLSFGELEAINYLIKYLEYNKK